MKNKAYIKPSKPALVVGLIAVVLMLVFGIFFMRALIGEGSETGVGFIAIWMLFVLLIGAVFVYNLLNKNEKKSIAEEITFTEDESQRETQDDFDTRLRKLELLRKDQLITEAEYRKKREEILSSKW
jgi:amino acid permease